MTDIDIIVIKGCLFASACFSLLLLAYGFFNGKLGGVRFKLKRVVRPFRVKLLTMTFLLLMAVWTLRFAVGYYSILEMGDGLSPLEEVFNSFLHALQTFSLDEQYRDFIISGKRMVDVVFPGANALPSVYGVYASVLNVLVPIAGGAVVFELISEFFPTMRLFFARFCIWNEQCYFSELNDRSVALAKSLLESRKHRIRVIFTDCNVPDKDRDRFEDNLATANSFGALCVKGDLLHIGYTTVLTPRKLKFFLIDEKENNNLEMLATMLERKRDEKAIKRSEIYVFASDQISSPIDEEIAFIINSVRDRVSAHFEPELRKRISDEKKLKEAIEEKLREEIPSVLPVNSIRNLVYNLFMELPLYEAIIDKKVDTDGKKDLNVTILGGGQIGTECFLTAYWCGQLPNTRLNLTVVSKEEKSEFKGKIDFINREIFNTSKADSELLKYNDKNYNSPYFSFNYKRSNILSADFLSLLKQEDTIDGRMSLLDTDYFVVALGSDEENFAVADKLRQIIGEYHLNKDPDKRREYKTIISYAIYNPEICRALNVNHSHNYNPEIKNSSDVFMYAFGNIDEVNSVKNVFFDGIYSTAYGAGSTYNHLKYGDVESFHKKDNLRKFKDIYSYQANVARSVYRKYLEYAAGLHSMSVFCASTKEEYRRYQNDASKGFVKMIVCDPLNRTDSQKETKTISLLNLLSQIEHRRWCAYMRTKGFRNPANGFMRYVDLESFEHSRGDHKFVPLKLHPCLVECSVWGIHADFDEKGNVITESEFKNVPCEQMDFLDRFSYERRDRYPEKEDCKQWDYPVFGFTDAEIAEAKGEGNKKKRKKRNQRKKLLPSAYIYHTMVYSFRTEPNGALSEYVPVSRFLKAIKRVSSLTATAKKKAKIERVAENGEMLLKEVQANIICPERTEIQMLEYSKVDELFKKMMKLG